MHNGERGTKRGGGSRPPIAAQVSYAKAIARERDITVPDEAMACSAAMSKWIDANKSAKPATSRKAPAHKSRDHLHGRLRRGAGGLARAGRRRNRVRYKC